MADENQPLLGGEHYLTDRELSERLKISRRTLQDYRNNGILPYIDMNQPWVYMWSPSWTPCPPPSPIDGFSSSVFNNVQLSERDALPFFLLNFSPFLFF